MVMSAKLELAEYVGRLRERNAHMQDVTADFPAAIKGLSSIDSMKSKIAAAMACAKIVASELDAKIKENLESLFTDNHDWRFLFPDPVSYTHLDVYKRQFLSAAAGTLKPLARSLM